MQYSFKASTTTISERYYVRCTAAWRNQYHK